MEDLTPPVYPAVAQTTEAAPLGRGSTLEGWILNWPVVYKKTNTFPLTHALFFCTVFSVGACAHACVPSLPALPVLSRRGNRGNLLATFVCRRTLMLDQS